MKNRIYKNEWVGVVESHLMKTGFVPTDENRKWFWTKVWPLIKFNVKRLSDVKEHSYFWIAPTWITPRPR